MGIHSEYVKESEDASEKYRQFGGGEEQSKLLRLIIYLVVLALPCMYQRRDRWHINSLSSCTKIHDVRELTALRFSAHLSLCLPNELIQPERETLMLLISYLYVSARPRCEAGSWLVSCLVNPDRSCCPPDAERSLYPRLRVCYDQMLLHLCALLCGLRDALIALGRYRLIMHVARIMIVQQAYFCM